MLKNNLGSTVFYVLALSIGAFSCAKKLDAPPIGDNLSFPGSIVAYDSNHFLMLNTSANGDYRDGSIQKYKVDSNGKEFLENSVSVLAHGSEIAVSPDHNLVALTFDTSVNPNFIQFYNYQNPSSPILLNQLNLTPYAAGGKQSIKRLGFFTPAGGGNYYYLYGTIYSFAKDDGSNAYIPTRVFVARVAKDFSSANIMFTLSYGLQDPNSLVLKSDSIEPYDYSFGSAAPTFDEEHNLFIAFPTGTFGGYSDSSSAYPPLPNVFNYLSGQSGANTVACAQTVTACTQPDMRAFSLIAVDFAALIAGSPLNNSTYFVPLAWNGNGIPYGATTNNNVINYANYKSVGSANSDFTSFSFQTNFWSSFWLNAPNLGNGNSQCYPSPSVATTSVNEYDINVLGGNGILISKFGSNGEGDSGYGNEVFQISGLDILSGTINYIKSHKTVNVGGESDFKNIASVQILDHYNTYYSSVSGTWLNDAVSPIVPYMYSRTSGIGGFDYTTSAPLNFGVLNFGSNTCLPYWVRDTYSGFVSWGLDSAWLGTSPNVITQGSNRTFYNASIDPTHPFNYAFPAADGAELCTDLKYSSNSSPKVFCANFLRSSISGFSTSPSGAIFTKY